MQRGYLTGKGKDWALALCRKDPDAFDAYLASTAPPFAHLLRREERPAFDAGRRADAPVSDEEASLCRQLGIAPGSLAA